MRAYNLAMFIIFINCGFALIAAFFPGIFGSEVSAAGDSITTLQSVLTYEIVNVRGYSFTGMYAFAGLLVIGTILVLNTTPGPTSQGYAYAVFAAVFWGGLTSTYTIITAFNIPGIEFFYTLFVMVATLIFIMALVQMSTGGQKSHV